MHGWYEHLPIYIEIITVIVYQADTIVNPVCIYVTGNLCNQAFRVMPKIFRHFMK